MIADKAAKKRGKGAHLLVPGGTFVMVSPELVRLLGGMAEAGLVGNLHQHCVRCADDDVPGRWQEGLCWVYGSHAHWAAQLGLTESGHEKLARRLTELGVILKRTDRARRAGARTWWAVDYDRLDELGYDASVDWKPVNRPHLRTPDEDAPDGPTSVEVAEWFEQFWAKYPKQTAKVSAEQVFRRKVKSAEEFQVVLDGLSRYMTGKWEFIDEDFIPAPAKFLREERFRDVV